jgi:aminobenzoyl-glutamate utilization protein A
MSSMLNTPEGLVPELRLPLPDQLIATRRDLHRNAEPGWCEFRTTAKVVETLRVLGWEVKFGSDVIDAGARMGLPPPDQMERFYRQAGADPDILHALRGGFTGAVASFKSPNAGPAVALRFEMDANLGNEATSDDHLPYRQGFASANSGVHHNCGHDGHTAIGLALARVLMESKESLRGRIRLIFQPAEEGLRGAAAMVAAGALDEVELFMSGHLGVQALKLGQVITGYRNILASVKLDAEFRGRSAHAAISPHIGRNALLAACAATQNLLAITRHGEGDTRVNVGLLSGGESRNAIPAFATLSAELRGETTKILNELENRADSILRGAALMHGVQLEVRRVGACGAASSDADMAELIGEAARTVRGVDDVQIVRDFKASDDVAAMMAAVQAQGGKAVYFGLGTELKNVHHSPDFDFDERVLPLGVDVFLAALKRIGSIR